jgi:GntR family transcriptional regulator
VYRQIATILRGRIIQNELPPGARLPAEGAMADEFNCGRDAVRDAVALLRGEGLIETKRGYRSQVRERIDRQRVQLAAGATVTARMPTPEERIAHDVAEGIPMLVVGDAAYPADRFELFNA